MDYRGKRRLEVRREGGLSKCEACREPGRPCAINTDRVAGLARPTGGAIILQLQRVLIKQLDLRKEIYSRCQPMRISGAQYT